MSFQQPVKTYISRGVQTGDDIPPSQVSSLCETQPLAPSSNLIPNNEPEGVLDVPMNSSEIFRGQLLGTLAYESAYIQSKTSEHSELLPLLSCKNKKYASFGVVRRSNPIGNQQRIASLPNPPPPPQNELLAERNTRVVSMPECLIQNSTGFYLGDSSFSTDDGNQPLQSPGRGQWKHGHDRNYLCDVPQTPSPPSSPDSIVIIANEPHIPGSFLRRPNSDDDGWATWASSPPRPIPALHGPLSLPYARCPSGAEGTVIEGDDLSQKIWGLGVGDSRTVPSTTARTGKNDRQQGTRIASSGDEFCVQSAKSFNEPNLDFQYPVSLQRSQANVIDLSRPSTFYNSSGFEGTFPQLNPDRFGVGSLPRLSLSSGPASKETQGISSSDGLKIKRPSSMQYPGNIWLPNTADVVNDHSLNSPTESMDGNWKRLRVGVSDPRIDKAGRTFGENGQNRLNKSAPVFVPGLDWQAKGTYMQYSRDGSHSDARLPRRVELFQQRHNGIISPTTSSPNWSPMFPHFVDIQTLTTPRHSQDNSMFPDPKIYSPALDDEDYSTKLMSMVQQFKNQEYFNIAKRYPTRTAKPAGDFLGERKGSHDTGHIERNLLVDENPSVHINLDARPSLSQQHPRSIPLARLIQRRLSSVPEEVGVGPSVSQLEQLEAKRPFSHESLDNAILHREIVPAAVNSQVEGVMQPAETIEERPDHGESNAIVRLPRKATAHHSTQPPTRSLDNKKTGRYEGRTTERKNNMNAEANGASVAVALMKSGNGVAKMKEGASTKDESA